MLGNEAKRQVYDIYGREGLAAGLQVVPSGKSTQELKQEWEGFRAQQVAPCNSCLNLFMLFPDSDLIWHVRDDDHEGLNASHSSWSTAHGICGLFWSQ